jgi:hypothetical protein
VAAFALSLLGGILVFTNGIVLLSVGGALAGTPLAQAGAIVDGIGVLAALFGLLIVALAVSLYRGPEHHKGTGIAILILSLVSGVTGGGFVIGLIVGTIGGILAILFEESEESDLFNPSTPSAPGMRCANCARPLSSGMTVCPFCDTPVRFSPGSRPVDPQVRGAPRLPPPSQ